MGFLESHIKQFVACKLEPNTPGCKLILQPEDTASLENDADSEVSFNRYRNFNWPYPRRHYV